MLKGTSMVRRNNGQNHHTRDFQCPALSCILQESSLLLGKSESNTRGQFEQRLTTQ